MRAIHSLLHPDDLARLVEREYALPAPVRVRLLRRGFNDTYLITAADGERRVLRVYIRDKYWIGSDSDLHFELDLLEHLASAGLGVARPYQRADGTRLGRLTAPEGERCFTLLTYADGVASYDRELSASDWERLGAHVARMHEEMDRFETAHDRYHLDERILVERLLTSLAAYAESAKAVDDLAELGRIGEQLTAAIRRLREIPGAYGVIHADLHRGNINVDEDGRFVLYDFDHCGYGLRAYDLASLYRGVDAPDGDRERWDAILAGYLGVRRLSTAEIDSFPLMAACRRLWDVGDWAGAADRAGDGWINETLIERLLAALRKNVTAAAGSAMIET